MAPDAGPLVLAEETCKLPGDGEKTLAALDRSVDPDRIRSFLSFTFQHISFLPSADTLGMSFAATPFLAVLCALLRRLLMRDGLAPGFSGVESISKVRVRWLG